MALSKEQIAKCLTLVGGEPRTDKPFWAEKILVPIFTRLQKYAIIKDVIENPYDYNTTEMCRYVGIFEGQHMLILGEILEDEGLLYRDKDSLLMVATEEGKAFVQDFEERTGEFLNFKNQ